MGRKFDKHGRMNWDDRSVFNSDVCDECGARVKDMDTHKALFHPKYRDKKLDKQSGFYPELYPDTGESGESYEKEIKPRQKRLDE